MNDCDFPWQTVTGCQRVFGAKTNITPSIFIYISLSLSPPTPADARGSASRIGGFRLCNNKNNNNSSSSSSSNNSSSVRRGRCFCHLLGTKLRGGLLFRSVTKAYRQPVLWGWLAGWLAARLQEGASSWKSEKKYFSWISERKLSIFGCFFCSFFGNEVGFCCFGRVAKAYRLLAFGHEIKFCFVVSDASQKHTAVGTKLRGGLLFRSVAKHTYSTAMLQMSRTFPVSVLWHLHLPVPGQMV